MNLGKHIHTLLKRQTEVHVPGLGSFRRVYNPATFDEQKNVFMPPMSYIEFDSLSTNGFDFVSYFQQVNQLERQEAERIVGEDVSSITAALDLSGEVSLEGLGQLVSYGNTAIFKPFDLSGFNFEPIETTIPHEKVKDKEEPISSEIEESIAEEETEVLPPVMVDEEPEEIEATNESAVEEETLANADELEEEEPSRGRSSLYVMIAVLALLALGGIYYFTQYNNKNPQATASTGRPDTTLIEAPVQSSVDTNVNMVDTTATTTVDTLTTPTAPAEMTVSAADESKKFTIVIGTHRTLAKAYEEAEAFNKDGHKTVRVVTPNLAKNLKRVIWDTYATKAERDSALQYVRKHVKTDAWPDVLK